MKPLFLLSSKVGKTLMVVCLSVIVLVASCGKKYDPVPEPVGDLNMMAVNTVAGSVNQDVLVNGTAKVSALAYGQASPYFIMTSGGSTIGFYDTGTTTTMNAGGQAALPIGARLSLYYFKDGNGKLQATLFEDATTNPATGKAKVRFIHMNNFLITSSSSSTPIAVAIDGSATALVPAITFANPSSYFEVDPGTKFNFTAANVVAGPAFDGAIVAGKIYTIWIDGTSATNLTGHIVLQN
jgi:hypothetical protein